ncbi:MAG: nucleoside triphosphate pyrophosphohydrolase, partial [Pseudomonadota bacterium]
MQPSDKLEDLLGIMAVLRNPQDGCPWDLKQTFSTITSYTIEEAYEVAEAAERGDMAALCDELGDLLLQVAFYAQMAKEDGAFNFDDVVKSISSKLIRRHPHIFAEGDAKTADDVKITWDEIKRKEKGAPEKLLDGVPLAMPALHRAIKLQEKASSVGFDWNDPRAVLTK